MMTKKHYEAFASEIRKLKSRNDRYTVIDAIVPVLQEDNERFDYPRFEKACFSDTV